MSKTLKALKPKLDVTDLSDNPKPILRVKPARSPEPCELFSIQILMYCFSNVIGCQIKAANPENHCNCDSKLAHVSLIT